MRRFESHQCFHFFFLILIVPYFHMCPLSIIGKQFYHLYKVSIKWDIIKHENAYMRDTTECIKSIGYAWFDVIKVSKGAKIRNRYNHVKRYQATQMVWKCLWIISLNEPLHEISNNVVCATSRASDQPAHTRSLIRAFASHLNILWIFSYCPNSLFDCLSLKGGCTGSSKSAHVKMPHCWKSHATAQ